MDLYKPILLRRISATYCMQTQRETTRPKRLMLPDNHLYESIYNGRTDPFTNIIMALPGALHQIVRPCTHCLP